ncbi:MarR family transcriptional regulator [Streptomyces venetus]|uniref:MarR family transcriptional regulator n=1 Tax=Streptomyces venetus TaxID=1701086 RepID=A0ABP8FWS6_9ACTN
MESSGSIKEIRGLVLELGRRLDAHMRECLGALNLTPSQATALWELGTPVTMRQLADAMTCEPSNVTFVIDRLEGQGLVERRPHPTDRRAKQLVLTPEGKDFRERLIHTLSADSPLSHLSAVEQERLREGLLRAVERSQQPIAP